MSDAGEPKKASIPEWQKNYTESRTDSSTADGKPTNDDSATASPERKELLDQAKEFLQDTSIRDAPRDRKVAFLQKKGLQSDDIQKLLGPETKAALFAESELQTIHDSTGSESSTKSSKSQTEITRPSTQESVTKRTSRDIPPIITYPEFILKPQKPPPLVTIQRLLNTAYALAGISTLTYGASKLLVQPMLESLTAARHDLAETTLDDIEKLNTKLEANVSQIPPKTTSKSPTNNAHNYENGDEVESITSDPTELFHRDMATQTSPQLSRTASQSSLNLASSKTNATAQQASRLSSLHSTLRSLLSDTLPSASSDDEYSYSYSTSNSLRDTVADFQTTLDNLQINGGAYNVMPEYNGIFPTPAEDRKKKRPGVTDAAAASEAAKVKAEIRALKGAF